MNNTRTSLRIAAALMVVGLLNNTTVQAQLQFIPEPWLRAWMNDLAPGCVNADGYLDPDYPALDNVHSAVLVTNVLDMTGIQYLHHLKELTISCNGAGVITPILPDSLERLMVDAFGFTEPLQLHSPLRYFEAGYSCSWSGSLVGPFPTTLDTLIVNQGSGEPLLLPALPPSLLYLDLYCWEGIIGLNTIPPTLRTLRLDSHIPICLPLLPQMMDVVDIVGSSAYCLPNLPVFTSLNGLGVDEGLTLCGACPECPCGPGLLQGYMWYDANGNNAHDGDEVSLNGDAVSVAPWGLTSVLPDGRWSMRVDTGTHAVIPQPGSEYLTTIAPPQHNSTLTQGSLVDNAIDFAYLLQPGIVDLDVDMEVSRVVRGLSTNLVITVRNVGVAPVAGEIVLHVDALLDVSIPFPEDGFISGNTVTWNFDDLSIGETRRFRVAISTPMDVALGTEVSFQAETQSVSTDITPSNNSAATETTVYASYDPNDKLVVPSTVTPEQAFDGEELAYTIRFQNTGNYPAARVIISDTLSGLLDPMSMRFTSSSHPCSWNVRNGVLLFVFDPIMLPDSGADQLGSQGFAKFKVRTVPGLQAGVVITNTANIYFDLNQPVITEPALCSIAEDANGLSAGEVPTVLVAPNPTSGIVRLVLTGTWGSEVVVTATDITGRHMRQTLRGPGEHTLDLGAASSGLLNIELLDGNKRKIMKLMKL